MKRNLLLISMFFMSWCSFGQGMQIDVQGSVVFNNSLFTISEAGEDFQANLTSEANTFISVVSGNYWDKKTNPNKKWRIEVNKTDVNWNDNLLLEIRRTGNGFASSSNNGNGNGNGQGNGNKKGKVQDGTVFVPVNNNSTYFFKGRDFVTNIPIEFRVSGLSISMGARDFETDIVFTIYDD